MSILFEAIARQVLRDRLDWEKVCHALVLAAGYEANTAIQNLGGIPGSEDTTTLLTYLDVTMLGLVPPLLKNTGLMLANPYASRGDHGLSDPLQLAAFFASNSMVEEAKMLLHDRLMLAHWHMLHRLNRAPADEKHLYPKWYFNEVEDRSTKYTWPCPPFEDLGLLPQVRDEFGLDTVFTCGAQTPMSFISAMKRALNRDNVGLYAMISGRLGNRLHDELAEVAYAEVVRLGLQSTSTAITYDAIARFLQLCSKDRARSVMNELSGARKVACLARYDATEGQFVEGLRAACSLTDVNRKEALRFVARTPTLAEIRAIRTSTIINVLDEMPWEIVEPLTKLDGIRGISMPFAERLGPVVLRRYLTDHPDRVKRSPDVYRESAALAEQTIVAGKRSMADWGLVMLELSKRYAASVAVRDRLNKITGNYYISALALLNSFGVGTEEITTIVNQHPQSESIRIALEGWEAPKMSQLWD